MSDLTLPSFRYSLEQQPPHTDCGGVVRGASVRQFPVSKGMGGASLRLQPGCLRELHWHSNAAELGLRRIGQLSHNPIEPRRSGDQHIRAGRCVVFPSRLGSFHPGNRAKRVPFHSDIRRRCLRRGSYT
jgi:oxalate decarboxylase